MGDPSGIGPEILIKALGSRALSGFIPLVFGDESLRVRGLHVIETGAPARPESATLCVVSQLARSERVPGRPSRAGGRAQLEYVRAAVEAAKRGVVDALCTGPVSKEQITRAGTPFMGHTELLAAELAEGDEVLMMMDGPRVRVALATNHLAIRDVPAALESVRLVKQLKLLSRALRPVVRRRPHIAVLALNPHAGEGGLLGDEERRVLIPAIQEARRRGVRCVGPLPADGVFARGGQSRYDVVLAMYHDQGLVVAKALDFDDTVNVTLGLKVPRTSVDHGVAYDIAGTGAASPRPMVAALRKALALLPRPAR